MTGQDVILSTIIFIIFWDFLMFHQSETMRQTRTTFFCQNISSNWFWYYYILTGTSFTSRSRFLNGFFSLKFEECLVANPSSYNASLRTWRSMQRSPELEGFFKALDSSICKNPFIKSTKISRRRSASSSVQFLALTAFFYRFFSSPFFNNK